MRADKRTRCRILYLIERTNRNILILLTRCCAIFLCYLGDGIYKGPINEISSSWETDSNLTVDEANRIAYFLLDVLAFLSLMATNFLKLRNQVES